MLDSFTYKNKAVSIKFFAEQTEIAPVEIIKYFFLRGIEMKLNSWLDEKYCRELCDEFGLKFLKEEVTKLKGVQSDTLLPGEDSSRLEWVKKAPVVAVMGHVDHGKTTLLDYIRKTNIASREYANITQHISSYQVQHKDSFITFLDTPGHEIFQKLRTIGGIIADIVILVISVEDGVQSQTKEVIKYYKEHNLKLIVFVNKIDRGEYSLDNLKQQLTDEDVVIEEYGGDVIFLKGSAKTGLGVDELLETITVVAEVESYSTTLASPAIGVILESRMEKGLGPIAETITIRGTLRPGDYIAGEKICCKLKTILNSKKERVDKLIPSVPATLSGFDQLPPPGKRFFSFSAKEEAWAHYQSLEKELNEGFDFRDDLTLSKEDDPTHFSFIVKSKVSGSAEAIREFISKFKYSVISLGSGEITEADIKLASIKKAIIVNFELKIPKKIEDQLKFLNITVWPINSVYELEERILEHKEKNRVIERIEKIIGRCKVIQLWTHSRIGTIAGCSVISGEIFQRNKVRVIREGNLLTKTGIKSCKIVTEEVTSAREGQEVGLVLHNWNDLQLDDVIESFEIIERKV
ncbi:translation initiation factor IF-2 [Candidatus Mycoplasma haematolamae str. Purdue]|uniref:Translation initiation factor IF-2 n=1 Tax=Mycoplasma haematolamae (strain Purdue) TaxID=1212765 RepID=I7C5C2_MYCHA|nr:translation initiation factor IF-2 [Candidatus Mycoplasma haematolamae]AFO51707.1 translation initiation factor IF-2 [Candidatus Mycoplasma haematolamae str. Purdue]